MKRDIIITIFGDICPTVDTKQYFETNQASLLFGDVLDDLKSSDFTIGNLECPLIESGKAALKTGPILRGKPNYMEVLTTGFNALSIANNHIRDFGDEGVISTIDAANKFEIDTLGASRNLTDAKLPYIKDIEGFKVGVLAFAEQEFNTADEIRPGANYLDLYYDFDRIKELKSQVDYLIILYHGGIEYYQNPSPQLQKKCRKMVESGADLVTCQHSHCIGTKEKYSGGEIIYGQGNSIFGFRQGAKSWNEGLLLQIKLAMTERGVVPELNYIPITATKDGGINKLALNQASEVIASMNKRSEMIGDSYFIEKEWGNYCRKKMALTIPQLLGYNRLLIHLNRILNNGLVRLLYGRKKLNVIQNLIRCEAHNEVINTQLKILK